jgi:hypothetical protein
MEKVVQSTTEVEFEDSTWVGEWVSYIIRDGSETSDRWLKVSRKETDGTLTDIDDLYNDNTASEEREKREAIVRRVAAERIKTIQSEYGIPSDDVDELAVSELILARVWAGEWMGQLRNSYYFFIDNLAEIFNKDFLEAASLVRTLNLQGKAGLNGFIIVPWQEEDSAFKSWEEATGHKKLIVSDGSGWGCQHCGNHGDERDPWASEVPCVAQEAQS